MRITKKYNKSISGDLIGDIRSLIETARHNVAVTVNAGLTILYWQIGNRIHQDILKEKRADYGKEIVATLSQELAVEYGRGFSRRNLFNMIRFAEVFPDERIVHALSAQLTWTHFREIIYLDNSLQRNFYAEMCRIERWNTRTLKSKIRGMLYERTAISKKPEELIKQEIVALRQEDRLTPDLVFRDPYFLDFLGLKDTYSEKDLKQPSFGKWRALSWSLESGFRLLPARRGSQSIMRIIILICSFSTENSNGSLPLN